MDKEIAIELDAIRTDGGTQAREEIDADTVGEYAEAYKNGADFPPVIVYKDRKNEHWLADGFTRLEACRTAGKKEIKARVRLGEKRDAILHAAGANAKHGLRRSNRDKRRAVEMLLRDDEWRGWSDHKIADTCCVSQPFVGKVRTDNGYHPEGFSDPAEPEKRTGRDGRTMSVSSAKRSEAKRGGATTPKPNEPAAAEPKPATLEERMAEWNTALERLARKAVSETMEQARELSKTEPGGAWLDESRLEIAKSQLQSAAGTFRALMAHAACNYCGGQGCKRCRRSGWLSRIDWENSR